MTNNMEETARELLKKNGGEKVSTIKDLREAYGIGLVDAKQIVDRIISDEPISSIKSDKTSLPTTFSLVYKGGHPKLNKEKKCNLVITDSGININCGFNGNAFVSFEQITGIHYETSEQIEKRITATRLLTLGVFALAFKKKKKNTEKYLTIDYTDNGLDNTILFNGPNSQVAHSEAFNRLSSFKSTSELQNQNDSNQQNTFNDPYEELKKLKELLDLEIVTQEEFDKKKKELLGL